MSPTKTASLTRLRARSGGFALAIGIAVAACSQSTATAPYTPITGIAIPASQITAGHGCGPRPGQVLKYAALVSDVLPDGGADTPFAANVFDCFTDGVFSLPVTDGGSPPFVAAIYAFSQCSFLSFMDGGLACPSNTTSVCQGQQPSVVAAAGAAADWTTSCEATGAPGVTVVATCDPLQSIDAGAGCPGDAAAE